MVKEIREELKKILRSKSAVIPNLLMILNGFLIVFSSKNIGHMPKIESVYQYPFCAVMLMGEFGFFMVAVVVSLRYTRDVQHFICRKEAGGVAQYIRFYYPRLLAVSILEMVAIVAAIFASFLGKIIASGGLSGAVLWELFPLKLAVYLLAIMLLMAAHCSLCFLVLCCLRGNVIWANVVNIGVIFFLSLWAIEKMEFTRKTIEGKLFWYYGDYVVQDILLSKEFLAEILYSIAVFAVTSVIGLFAILMQKKIGGSRSLKMKRGI